MHNIEVHPDTQPSGRRSINVPRRRLYSASRRFDLASVFVMIAAYSVLLAIPTILIRTIEWVLGIDLDTQAVPKVVFAVLPLFVAIVGIGQALLFRGKRPRLASLLMGVFAFGCCCFMLWHFTPPSHAFSISGVPPQKPPLDANRIGFIATCSLLFGPVLGYLAGVFVGGLFMIVDVVCGRFGRNEQSHSTIRATHVQKDVKGPSR